MLLLYEYKPPRVTQGPCITGHRDKKKEGGEQTAGACKSLSSPFRPLGEAEKLQHVISVRRGVECQFNAFLFSFIFFVCALLDRHTYQGSYSLLVLVRC